MSRCFRTLVCSALVLACSLPLSAADLTVEYVEGLRAQGLGDMGMYYLQQLEAEKKIPASLTETFDLELARCMQVAAQRSENSDEAAQLRVATRTQLDKFLTEHSTHADAAQAFDTYGVLSLSIGNASLKEAFPVKDPVRKEQLLALAKTAFEESRPRFTEAEKMYKVRFDALTQAADGEGDLNNAKVRMSKQRQADQLFAAEDDWLTARFNLAMVDYYIAQTLSDPKHKELIPTLLKAELSLDAIWQGYRGKLPGVRAHYWTGRVNEQMGQISEAKEKKKRIEKALDIYDEVTANEPDTDRKVSESMMNFFGENFLRRMQLLSEINQRDILFEEANPWLKDNIGRKTDAYYGVVVEVAKAYIAESEGLAPAEKAKMMSPVVRELRDIMKVTSSYQNDVIMLYRLHAKAAGEETMEAKTFDEAMALADAAMDNGEHAAAVESLERAIVLQDQEKDKNRLQLVQYQLALAKYQSGDIAGSFAIADKFARAEPESKYAPAAAALGINGALALFSSTQDRAAAEQQLNGIVDYTIKTWPNRTESDDARIALGRVKMFKGDLAGAIAVFEKLNPASDRFPQAQNLSAQNHRRLYLMAKQANKLDDATKAHLPQAIELFEKALANAGKSLKPEDAVVAAECRLNLGEIYIDAGETAKAVAIVAPVESKIIESNPQALDSVQVRTLILAGRGHLTLKDFVGALPCGQLLLSKGPDIPQVSFVLVGVCGMLRDVYKVDQVQVMEITNKGGADQAVLVAAQAKADTSKQVLVDFLTKLLTREKLRLPELVVIGDSAADVGQNDLAKATYQRVLDVGQTIPKKTPAEQAAITRVQSALIGLLRADRQFTEALTQVDALIKTQPNALDPLIERARILQGMAEDDASKWKAATDEWAKLKALYTRAPKKPASFNEMVYNTAACLHGQARNAADSKSADEYKKQARGLLKTTLATNPELKGSDGIAQPEMVAKFNALFDELQ